MIGVLLPSLNANGAEGELLWMDQFTPPEGEAWGTAVAADDNFVFAAGRSRTFCKESLYMT